MKFELSVTVSFKRYNMHARLDSRRPRQDTGGLDDICSRIPQQCDSSLHGCHRWCFKQFTNVKRLELSLSKETAGVVDTHKSRRYCRSYSRIPDNRRHVTLFPQDRCIFCNKHVNRRTDRRNFFTIMRYCHC